MESTSSISKSSNFSYNLNLCEKLLSFIQLEKFSDICIIGSDNDVKFHAHKCVLAASSDYFMAMFDGSLKEAIAGDVKIHDIKSLVLRKIIAFMYTGIIELQNDTIQDILSAANYLQIQPLIFQCYNFMGTMLNAKNCLDIALFADQHSLIELSEKASKFASSHFEDISNGKQFLQLNDSQVSAIISSEDLCVSSEENVFLRLIKWIEHDKPNREKYAFNLFSKVRYWLLNVDFIKQHRSTLPNLFECIEMICTWLEWHSIPKSQRETKPMEFLKPKKVQGIVVYGKQKKQTYDPTLNIWRSEIISKLPSFDIGNILMNDKLIYSNNNRETPLMCFDLQTEETTKLPSMRIVRTLFGSVVLNDELYIVGGLFDKKWTRVVEKYNFSTGKWRDVTPMDTKVYFPKVAVANGQLYVVGELRPANTMLCLNPAKNEWTSEKFLGSLRMRFGFAGVGRNLYVVGGIMVTSGVVEQIKIEATNSVEIFEPSNGKWRNIKPMPIPLSDTQCTSLNNRLIALGGMDDTSICHNLVQEYSLVNNEWKKLCQLNEYSSKNTYAVVEFD